MEISDVEAMQISGRPLGVAGLRTSMWLSVLDVPHLLPSQNASSELWNRVLPCTNL